MEAKVLLMETMAVAAAVVAVAKVLLLVLLGEVLEETDLYLQLVEFLQLTLVVAVVLAALPRLADWVEQAVVAMVTIPQPQ
jgi:hypothetical protein